MSKKSRRRPRNRGRLISPLATFSETSNVAKLAQQSSVHQRVIASTYERLQGLAENVGRSLVDQRMRRVAATAVLLTGIVTSAVACSDDSDYQADDADNQAVAAQVDTLSAEVSDGLPPQSGQTYSVRQDSIWRDQQGVYHFEWLDAASNEYHQASASRLQLTPASTDHTELTISQEGVPVLSMPGDESIALVWPRSADDSADAQPTETADTATPGATSTPTPVGSRSSGGIVYVPHYGYYPWGFYSAPWHPFYSGGTTVVVNPGPSGRGYYYDPPTGVSLENGKPLNGGVSATTPRSFADRAISPVAVSGMKGGTGGGLAVTGKASGPVSGMTRGVGSGRAVGSKAGGSTGGVRAPASSGFSSGKGSSGGAKGGSS